MKKVTAIILAVALLLMQIVMGVSASNVDPTITIESMVAGPGESVSVKVEIDNNPGIWGMDLMISYDKTALTLTNVENGDFYQESEWTKGKMDADVYVLSYEAGGFENVTTKSGTLAILTFMVNDDAVAGDHFVSASYDAGDIINVEFEDIDFNIVDGGVTVQGGHEGCAHGRTELRDMREGNCLEDGYTGDTWCLDCGEMIASGTVIPAPGYHTGGEATCIESAVCDACGLCYGYPDGENHKGATEVRGATDADCGNDGYTGDTYCVDCGEIIAVGSVIGATGDHADLDRDGACDTCGTELEVPTDPTEPSEPSEPSEPTEPSEPSEPSEPTEPSEPDEQEKPSSAQSWRDLLKKIFGNWWKDEDSCEHTYTSEVKAPSCTQKGCTVHTCSKCGDSYEDSYTDALGHDYVDGSCTVCGEKEPDKESGTGFDWSSIWQWLFGFWR